MDTVTPGHGPYLLFAVCKFVEFAMRNRKRVIVRNYSTRSISFPEDIYHQHSSRAFLLHLCKSLHNTHISTEKRAIIRTIKKGTLRAAYCRLKRPLRLFLCHGPHSRLRFTIFSAPLSLLFIRHTDFCRSSIFPCLSSAHSCYCK